MTHFSSPSSLLPSSPTAPPILPTSSLEDVNNNEASARLQMTTGIQVIPSRLPTGELALLLPGSSSLFSSPPEVSSSESSTDRLSAFTVVDHKTKSPLPSPTSSTEGDPYLSPHSTEVTSTSISYDSIFKVPSLQPKILPKHSFFSPYTNESSLLMKAPHPPSSVIYRPLITSLSKPQESKRPGFRIEVDDEKKDPIDFSMKKLVAPHKTPLSDLPCNIPLLKTTSKVPGDGESHSTSASMISSSVATTSTSDSGNRDMWRPW